MRFALAIALVACSPTYYVTTKRCATTTMLVTDFVTAALAVTVAGIHWSGERYIRSGITGAAGVGLWTAANLSEIRCAR